LVQVIPTYGMYAYGCTTSRWVQTKQHKIFGLTYPSGWLGPMGGVMPQPMYQQIADDLRKQIDAGILKPGQQLPTEILLREQYNASRNTIRDAIKRLTSLGMVETRPGAGTYVTKKIDPFVTVLSTSPEIAGGSADPEGAAYRSEVSVSHRKAEAGRPEVRVQMPSVEIANRLRRPSDAQVICRSQERYIDGTAWSIQSSFYPMEFATEGGASRLLMADDIKEGAVRYLESTMGLKQVGYREWITARAPDNKEQNFFGIPHNSTVFELFRTGFDQNQKPMRVTVTIYPADRNQFIVDSGTVPAPRYEEEAPG
jgi:GntR family transcriptional regulator